MEKVKTTLTKVKYIRPKYKNLKEWIEDENNVYIGRGKIVFIEGKRYSSKDSIWSNPYKIGKDGNRKQVLIKYKKYITKKIKNNEITIQKLNSLRGKNLGCWRYPEECHDNILIHIIDIIDTIKSYVDSCN